MNLFVKIDGKGLVHNLEDQPIMDLEVVHDFLNSLHIDNNHAYKAKLQGQSVFVEAYSFPLIATNVHEQSGAQLHVDCINDYVTTLDLQKAFLDHQDRFIIYSVNGLPVLLSPEAQEQVFDMADSFTDDSITLGGVEYQTPIWLGNNDGLSDPDLWTKRYETNDMGWDMGAPSPSLVWAVEKLKLPKMRVAVLGCGAGHDAHFLASKGHMVTGIDFSPEAIKRAESLYPSQTNLKWVCRDVFEISEEYRNSFDLVIEHTCFCAIDPERRSELVSVWKNILSAEGQLLGVFFVMPKNFGPPYGGTEEELNDLLSPYFRYNLWVRSKASHPGRLGKELVVLARLKNRLD